jgi:chromosomal replication initiation ATPase DnaA
MTPTQWEERRSAHYSAMMEEHHPDRVKARQEQQRQQQERERQNKMRALIPAYIPGQRPAPEIMPQLACLYCRCSMEDLMSGSRFRVVARARAIAAVLLRRLCCMSYPEIAVYLGTDKAHHSTIMSAIKRGNATLAAEIKELTEMFTANMSN